jgi:hypothetical protein
MPASASRVPPTGHDPGALVHAGDDHQVRHPFGGPPLTPQVGEPAGLTLSRLAVLLVLVVALARLCHIRSDAAWALLAAVTVRSLASCAFWFTPVAGAALTWVLGTGFLAPRAGELGFGIDDREHLAVLALAALVALVVSARARRVATARAVPHRAGRDA